MFFLEYPIFEHFLAILAILSEITGPQGHSSLLLDGTHAFGGDLTEVTPMLLGVSKKCPKSVQNGYKMALPGAPWGPKKGHFVPILGLFGGTI